MLTNHKKSWKLRIVYWLDSYSYLLSCTHSFCLQNSVYIEPCYAGDTFHKVFSIREIRGARDGKACRYHYLEKYSMHLNYSNGNIFSGTIVTIVSAMHFALKFLLFMPSYQATVVTIKCDLLNQRDHIVFSLDKV